LLGLLGLFGCVVPGIAGRELIEASRPVLTNNVALGYPAEASINVISEPVIALGILPVALEWQGSRVLIRSLNRKLLYSLVLIDVLIVSIDTRNSVSGSRGGRLDLARYAGGGEAGEKGGEED